MMLLLDPITQPAQPLTAEERCAIARAQVRSRNRQHRLDLDQIADLENDVRELRAACAGLAFACCALIAALVLA